VAVSIDDTFEKKIDMLDAHVSQVYEWLPCSPAARGRAPRSWSRAAVADEGTLRPHQPAVREGAREILRRGRGRKVQHAEAYQNQCEYEKQPDDAEIRRLFPFFSK